MLLSGLECLHQRPVEAMKCDESQSHEIPEPQRIPLLFPVWPTGTRVDAVIGHVSHCMQFIISTVHADRSSNVFYLSQSNQAKSAQTLILVRTT